MCGFFCYHDTGGRPLSRGRLMDAATSIAHRGPDGAGAALFENDSVALAHVRLAILDTSDLGNQPMFSQDRSLCMVYNGEIYNYREIRKTLEGMGHGFRSNSDSEVLLEAYRRWGEKCLDRLNGMFSFAIWNLREKTLFAARDRLGIKPLYWMKQGNTLALASEAKAFFAAGLIRPEPDLASLHNPWHFMIGENTGFAGVHKLGAGELLKHGPDGLRRERWWRLRLRERNIGETRAVEELDALLNDAVKLQMVSDVPVGAFLSGGLDSSIITALMARHIGTPPRTFTINFTSGDKKFESMPDDGMYARKVARNLGCSHEEIFITPRVAELLPKMIRHMDEPLADPAALNVFLISEAARKKGVPVLLNGMGGDEVFGGYRKQLACLLAERYQRIPSPLRRIGQEMVNALPVASGKRGFRTLRWAKRFLSFADLDPTRRFMQSDQSLSPEGYARLHADPASHPYDALSCVQAQRNVLEGDGSYLGRMCLRDTLFFLTDHNLLYTDKATMAASVEGRPPLIDHRIVEWAFTLPPHLRINGRIQKYILKKVSEPYLERDIIHRPKAPFAAPLRSWIRGDLREMVHDTLTPGALKDRGIYNPSSVARLIREEMEGLEDHSQLLWTLLTRELWFKTFIDGPLPTASGPRPEIVFHEADDPKA